MKTLLVKLLLGAVLLAGHSSSSLAGEWYRGDLHAHSTYSDGDSSVADMIARAESLGFDFFTLTDHDTSLSGTPVHWSDPAYYSHSMIILYGVEWTTASGHANIWAKAPFSYKELWQAHEALSAEDAIAAAHRQGALFSINHPSSYVFTAPWEYPAYEGADSVEVWNALYRLPSLNGWAGHVFWDGLLISGRRIPCVGGSDTHMLKGWMALFYGIGNPTTWVYAEDRTADALLEGIKAGHASISYAPDAVRLDFKADADADGDFETAMGESISGAGQSITFNVRIVQPGDTEPPQAGKIVELDAVIVKMLEDGTITENDIITFIAPGQPYAYLAGVFKNGSLVRVWLLFSGAGSVTFKDKPSSSAYYRVELVGNPRVSPMKQLLYGKIIALTNPIYVDVSE
ncbi:MAG: CehA/McbA family metallohydrolase [Pseudomonadota bacterium]